MLCAVVDVECLAKTARHGLKVVDETRAGSTTCSMNVASPAQAEVATEDKKPDVREQALLMDEICRTKEQCVLHSQFRLCSRRAAAGCRARRSLPTLRACVCHCTRRCASDESQARLLQRGLPVASACSQQQINTDEKMARNLDRQLQRGEQERQQQENLSLEFIRRLQRGNTRPEKRRRGAEK